jgi:arylformamidase
LDSPNFATPREIIDLSVPMKSLDTPVYPGYPQPLRSIFTTVSKEGYASFIWMFAEHTSTHVDSPAHFFDSALTVDQVPLKNYAGPGVALDFTSKLPKSVITRPELEKELSKDLIQIGPGSIVLFYTGYTQKASGAEWMNHPSLGEDACRYLADLRINAVGFDAPSPDHPPFPAHKTLLPKSVAVYENLTNLDKLIGKNFFFIGAPLKLTGGSASPVRAMALLL